MNKTTDWNAGLAHEIIAQLYEAALSPERTHALVRRISILCGCECIEGGGSTDRGGYDSSAITDDSGSDMHLNGFAETVIDYVLGRCPEHKLPYAHRILQQLRPHIIHAGKIAKKLRSLERERDALEGIARWRGLIVLLYDVRKRLLSVLPNDARLQVPASVAVLDESGLHIADRVLARKFDIALSSCICAHDSDKPDAMDALTLVCEGAPQQALRVITLGWCARDGDSQDIAAVAVLGDDSTPWIDRDLMQEVYGLSQAEAMVALAIVQGRHCNTIAHDLCITRQVVLTHIKSILSKCNVSNQTQLVYVLLCSPAAYVFRNGLR